MALLSHQQKLHAATIAKAKVMHRDAVRGLASEVHAELLSGTTSTNELRRMGHPFARRKLSRRGFERTALKGRRRLSVHVRSGVGIAIPKLPINRQTGELARSMRMRAVPNGSASQELQLGFTAEYAKFILGEKGTRRMVARGFQAAKRKLDTRMNKRLSRDLKLMILRAAVSGKA